jgi:hypothetical protein
VLIEGLVFKVGASLKNPLQAGFGWLMPIILATQEAEFRRIKV